MATLKKDIVVIGGGPAGYIAAIKAARLGAEVLLAEELQVGGTCLNRGCIPTKFYAQSAHTILELSQAESRGIEVRDPQVSMNMKKALAGKNKTVKKLTAGVRSLLKHAGVVVENQRAHLTEGKIVQLADGTIVEAGAVILATGSLSSQIPIEGIESPLVMDSDQFLDLDYVPKRIAVIGGGVIGIEFASIFQAFGSAVTVVEAQPSILPMFDSQAIEITAAALKKRGITIYTDAAVKKITTQNDEAEVHLTDGTTITVDVILLAVGRISNLSCIDDKSKIEVERGRVLTDDTGMTSEPGVYAAGDITGRKLLAHAAYQMGETVAHNACVDTRIVTDAKKKFDLDIVPSVVYSIPEVASVGLSENEAAKKYETVVGKFPLSANGRALSGGETEGFVKVVAEKKYGQILGVCCVGMYASEVINEAALAMRHELTVYEVAETIHGHPTISEAFMEAASSCIGQCYHMM
jgi:dihydrolipoamide dehydrogenase